jgi:hypothetical protein
VRVLAIVALLASTAFADPPRLVVHRYDGEVCGRHGCAIHHGFWLPALDGVEISRDRFYTLVGRPDLARRARLRRIGGASAMILGAATMVFGLTYGIARDHPGVAVGMWVGGALGGVAGLALYNSADPVRAGEAERLVEVARF